MERRAFGRCNALLEADQTPKGIAKHDDLQTCVAWRKSELPDVWYEQLALTKGPADA